MVGREILFLISLFSFHVQVKPLTCHYCNIITDFYNPLDRVPCDTVRKAIMRNSSLYTMQCGDNEYCMHYKGQYRDHSRDDWREEEFGGCSGRDDIYIEDVKESEQATGAFVDWKKRRRSGKICLSLKEKSCFDCDKSKCEELWPKPKCLTGTLRIVPESSGECCPEYTCGEPLICHYCNVVTKWDKPMDRVSCDTVRKAIMRNSSLYTMQCSNREYCMHYKGLFKDDSRDDWRQNEIGGCSGLDYIYTGDASTERKTDGTFVHWENRKRKGHICLSLNDKGCFDCDKSTCDQLWPKPPCPMGSLVLADESGNQCCPEYKCSCDKSKCDHFWPLPECPTGTLVPVNESADHCCAEYKCELPRKCHYCNVNEDYLNPLDDVSCETVKVAIMKNESLYTTDCPYNEYCMYYKGIYKEKSKGPAISVEFAGCSSLVDIYVGDINETINENGNFVRWMTPKRNGKVCLSLKEKSCCDCDKTKCDQLWPKPECSSGTLRIADDFPNKCCPKYECVNTSSVGRTLYVILGILTVAILLVSVIGGCVWYMKNSGNIKQKVPLPNYKQRDEYMPLRTSTRNAMYQIDSTPEETVREIAAKNERSKGSNKHEKPQANESGTCVTLYDDNISGNPVWDLSWHCKANNLPPPAYKVLKTEHPHGSHYSINCIIGKLLETGTGISETLAGRQAAHNMLGTLEDMLKKQTNIKEILGYEDENYKYMIPSEERTPGTYVWDLKRLCMLSNWPPPIYKLKMIETQDKSQFSVICVIENNRESGNGESESVATQRAVCKMLCYVQDKLGRQSNRKQRLFHDDQRYTYITIDDSEIPDNPVGHLQDMCKSYNLSLPIYMMSQKGPQNDRSFTITCVVERFRVTGSGVSETLAGRRAAHKMVRNIRDKLFEKIDNKSQPHVGEETHRSSDDIPGDPVWSLQKLCLNNSWPLPRYKLVINRVQNACRFCITCNIGTHTETGDGKSLPLARRQAAHKMLQKMKDSSAVGDSDEKIRETSHTLAEYWEDEVWWNEKMREKQRSEEEQEQWLQKKKQQWEKEQSQVEHEKLIEEEKQQWNEQWKEKQARRRGETL